MIHDSRCDVIAHACAFLLQGDRVGAREVIVDQYPLDANRRIVSGYAGQRSQEAHLLPGAKRPAGPSVRKLASLHARDGYIDRYTGQRLVSPIVLKLLGHPVGPLSEVIPYHVNEGRGNASNGAGYTCHQAGWEIYASYEHVRPIAVGGTDDLQNLVTSSIDTNFEKGTQTWEPAVLAGSLGEWDGLSGWFLQYTMLFGCSWLPHGREWRSALEKSLAR